MIAIPIDLTPGLPHEMFDAATARVNEWRGHCVDLLTRAESAVTTSLETLSEVNGRGQSVKLHQFNRQRYDALIDAIGSAGPFAAEGGVALATLENHGKYGEVRNMLCHGTIDVTLDREGRWTIVLRQTTFRTGRAII